MRKRTRIVGAVVGVCTFVGAIALTGTSSGAAAPARAGSTVFIADSTGFFRSIDEAAPGLSTEDLIFEKSPVLDVATGDRIGVSTTRIQVVKVELEGDDTLSIMDSTVVVDGGRITFSGSFRTGIWQGSDGLGWRGMFPITGGTGAHQGASGTVVAEAGQLDGVFGTFLHIAFS
jgi:type IV secretory pathway protease TraF